MKMLFGTLLLAFSVQAALAFDDPAGLHDPGYLAAPYTPTSLVVPLAGADFLVGGNEFSVADSCGAPVGTHFHSDDGGSFGNGPDFVEVGNFSCEEVRGMVEFPLADELLPRFIAEVTCFVYLEGGLFPGVNDYLTTFDIDAYSYNANFIEELEDFQISTTGWLDTFSTGGLVVGDELSFDVTGAYNDAFFDTGALGMRLQPATDPDGGAITFEECNLFVTGKVVDIDIKFCSNPNAFNSKSKGGLPVTIFGDGVYVKYIDLDTLQLCLDAEGTDCTPAGVKSYSYADRGNPLTDLGADSCAIVDGVEMDYLNPDGDLDLDAVFSSEDVADLIGSVAKGDVVGPLYLIGYLYDGTPITSVPVLPSSLGIDLLWIVK